MKYSPHEYQEYAVRFIEENPVAAVLLDMGNGKDQHCADCHCGADV